MTLIASLIALAIPASAPKPYWEHIDGCKHGHTRQVVNEQLSKLLKNHTPITDGRNQAVRHTVRCVFKRSVRLKAHARVERLREWRKRYIHKWPIKFHSLPSWVQSWAWSTGACESGNRASIATGNGFYGAFQFMLSTWWAAGGTGMPNQHIWHYQAWIASNLMLREGSGHWPNCG